ncbi:heat shock 70 kDa protein 12A-like [Ylistrum balloti]|uniref:heat shock 70 kDa protein 12A-like n=1 Tax=Ylistrum balloti TaxID=509963 RepID=UPI002905C219|nr:heat shock 70 kDa protein 12A-like [Ylistrum balloti]
MADNTDLPHAVVAIDFGTSYSGYAFTYRDEYKKSNNAREIFHNSWASGIAGNHSVKAPTVALFNPNKEFYSFGYEAEEKFSELTEYKKHKGWYYFSKFKMQLFDKMKLSRDLVTADQSGKVLPAITVFSESLGYLVRAAIHQVNRVSEKDITWVITVPAIWTEPAKQFMREAVIKTGIDEDKLLLALEPEAAALYCRYLPTTRGGKDENDILGFLNQGGRYMIVDMGGGTVDIAVHEVSEDGKKLTEIIPASGGAWGGDSVNKRFFNYFDKKIKHKSRILKQSRTSHWMALECSFEAKKRQMRSKTEHNIRLQVPPVIITEGELDIDFAQSFKLNISNKDFRSFFESANDIISHMEDIFGRVADIELILLVGGCAQSDYIANMIRERFSDKTVLVPTKAEEAVMEGAVLFGFDPWTVSARMCRHTYGIDCSRKFREGFHREEYRKEIDGRDMCQNIFSKVVTEGDILEFSEKCIHDQYFSSHKDKSRQNIVMKVPFYASTDKSCRYTTDQSCEQIGIVEVTPPVDGWPDHVKYRIEMYFGRTEFAVKVFNDADESECDAKFDFLLEQKIPELAPISPAPAQVQAPAQPAQVPAPDPEREKTRCVVS